MDKRMQEYKCFKADYPGHILLYQAGIFYRIMFEDAEKVAETLGLKLQVTGEAVAPVPMCGFPKSGLDKYVGKLIRADFMVAICHQTKNERGAILREVSEVVPKQGF